jgi:hypothetical protein
LTCEGGITYTARPAASRASMISVENVVQLAVDRLAVDRLAIPQPPSQLIR